MENNFIVEEDLRKIYNSGIDWSKFYNSTVLISGANGFLPAYIVKVLLYLNKVKPASNVRVIGLVRNIEKANLIFKNYIEDNHLSFIVQDVSEKIEVKETIDYIIHAASQASPKFYGVDPVGTLNANVLGTINLLNLAREKKIKSFLFFSSGEVYGKVNSENIPIKETSYGYLDPIDVRSCYAESKRMGENICISYYYQFQVPVKIVRPFHTYGPGMALDDGRVFADFVSNAVNNQNLVIKSDGSAKRAFCYLSDATEGFLRVLLSGHNGNAYNIGNPNEEYSVKELGEVIVKIFPEKKNGNIF